MTSWWPFPIGTFRRSRAAGALRSSANDLLTFLGANLGYVKSPLAPAMAAMLSVRRPTGAPGLGEIGLAWLIAKASDDEIVWHNGGTGGYRSFIGYDAKTRVGVVVLSNTFTGAGVDDIGMHLLDSHVPLLPAPKEHKEITVDPKIFDGYVGRYQLAPNFILTITREGDQLFAQATGQPKVQVFPESRAGFLLQGCRCANYLRNRCQRPCHQPDPAPERPQHAGQTDRGRGPPPRRRSTRRLPSIRRFSTDTSANTNWRRTSSSRSPAKAISSLPRPLASPRSRFFRRASGISSTKLSTPRLPLKPMLPAAPPASRCTRTERTCRQNGLRDISIARRQMSGPRGPAPTSSDSAVAPHFCWILDSFQRGF